MRRGWECILTAALAGCGNGGGGQESEKEVAPRVPVATAPVVRDTITEELLVVGRLVPVPGGAAVLTAPAAGVVKSLPVQVGSRVAAGTVLVDLDVPELAANARQLTAAAEVAEREAARQQELLQQGITSRKEADQKVAAATGARSAAEAAQRLLERAHVKSPLSGGVQRVLVHLGERVAEGAPLVEVVSGTTLQLVAPVPALQMPRLRPGQVAIVAAEGGAELPGQVRALSPAVDSVTNAGELVIQVQNPKGILRAGSAASGRIILRLARDALVVPDSALVLVGGQMTVFVVGTDSVAKARPVQVGIRQRGRAAVDGRLEPGELVATTGAYGLADGMRVIPRAATRP